VGVLGRQREQRFLVNGSAFSAMARTVIARSLRNSSVIVAPNQQIKYQVSVGPSDGLYDRKKQLFTAPVPRGIRNCGAVPASLYGSRAGPGGRNIILRSCALGALAGFRLVRPNAVVDGPLHRHLRQHRDPAALGSHHQLANGGLPVLWARCPLRQSDDVIRGIAQGPQGAAVDANRVV